MTWVWDSSWGYLIGFQCEHQQSPTQSEGIWWLMTSLLISLSWHSYICSNTKFLIPSLNAVRYVSWMLWVVGLQIIQWMFSETSVLLIAKSYSKQILWNDIFSHEYFSFTTVTMNCFSKRYHLFCQNLICCNLLSMLCADDLRCCLKTMNNTPVGFTVALGDMFLYYDEPGHCTLLYVYPTHPLNAH